MTNMVLTSLTVLYYFVLRTYRRLKDMGIRQIIGLRVCLNRLFLANTHKPKTNTCVYCHANSVIVIFKFAPLFSGYQL